MAKDKKIVYFYTDWIEIYEDLSDDEAGKLIKHKLRYLNDLDPKAPSRLIELLFKPFQIIFKRDLRAWDKTIVARSEAGKKGAEIKKLKQTQANVSKPKNDEAKQADKVKDKVKDNDIDKDIDKDSLYNIDFLLNHYLENEILINAFCEGQKTNKNTVISKLKEFNISLSETDVKMKTWNDYTFHFRNWFKKNKVNNNNNGTKPNKPTF